MTQNQKITSRPRSLDFPPDCGKFVTWQTMENGAGDLLLPLSVREHTCTHQRSQARAFLPSIHTGTGPGAGPWTLSPFPSPFSLLPSSPLSPGVCASFLPGSIALHTCGSERPSERVRVLCVGETCGLKQLDTAGPLFPARAICHVNSGLLSAPGPATRGDLLPLTPPVCTD